MTDDFSALLTETKVVLTPPADFLDCAPRLNSVFSYQHAHRSPCGDLELRYRINSIKRMGEERRLANAGVEVLASVDLNRLHEMSFQATLFNLHGGAMRPPSIFKPEEAREFFGADWAAMCFFPLAGHDFAPGYDTAGAFCIHKHDVADVMLIAVFNDGVAGAGNAERLFDEPPGFRFT